MFTGARPRRFVLAILAALVLPLAAAASASATTYYVDRNAGSCTDAGAGSASQPFCTIDRAADKVVAGDGVQVAGGTYPEAVTVSASGTSSAPIAFAAADGAVVTVTGQDNGFVLSGVSWVAIHGFRVTNTSSTGVSVSSSSHITLSQNDVSNVGQRVNGATAPGIRLNTVSDSVVSGNKSHDNSDYGIYLSGNSTRNQIRGNTTYNDARGYTRIAAGIRMYSSPGNTVENNISHHNEDSGIESYAGSNNTLLRNNLTYANGDHGIDNYNSTGQRIIGNTVYKNITAGINVEAGSTGATVANNVSVDNGINSPRTRSNIRVDSQSVSGSSMDSDLVYLSTPDVLLVWNSTSYTSLAAFQLATGQETHGLQADPKWKSAINGDFRLTTGSPAIDSANSAVSGEAPTDLEGLLRFDDPPTPNTGLGARLYDDRGAFEFAPTTPPGDQPPTAVLDVSPMSGTAPLAVAADASRSTDSDATPIASYSFDFGDGTAVVGPQPGATAAHTYTGAGSYTLTVTVTDSAGNSSTATATVQVAPGESAPAAALAVTPSSGKVNLNVTADASASTDDDGTPIASYTFDFGDGSASPGPQTTPTAAHTYTRAGTYTVKVTVKDTAGLSSTATAQVSVTDDPPVAQLRLSRSTIAAHAVLADSSASTDTDGTPIASYTFNFGDGSQTVGPQPGPTATHAYAAAGNYTVTVTVRDTAGLSSTVSKRFKVK